MGTEESLLKEKDALKVNSQTLAAQWKKREIQKKREMNNVLLHLHFSSEVDFGVIITAILKFSNSIGIKPSLHPSHPIRQFLDHNLFIGAHNLPS